MATTRVKGKTHWNVCIDVDGQTKCSTGADTLGGAITRAMPDALYYMAIYPGAKVVLAEIHESCSRCGGDGTVLIRMLKRKTCPECRGKLPTGKCEDIAIDLPDSTNKVKVIQEE